MQDHLDKRKAEWIETQLELASKAIFDDDGLSFTVNGSEVATDISDLHEPICRHAQGIIQDLHTIGGLDISFIPESPDEAVATLTVLTFPDLKLVHEITRHIYLTAPYIPSFLSMREAEHLVDLIQELRVNQPEGVAFPQVFLVDGNGRLHEREAGLATVVGVLANVPTIGCAKDYHPVLAFNDSIKTMPDWRLTQRAFKSMCRQVFRQRGDWLGIHGKDTEQYIGAALLSSPDSKASSPIYVSPGHRISLETAIGITLACCKSARVPESIRFADSISRQEAARLAAPTEASTTLN